GLLVHGGHVVAAFVEVLATLLLWSVMRRFAGPRWSLVLVLLYFLATSVRTVASQALWQHSGVHLAVAAALWLMLREEQLSLGRAWRWPGEVATRLRWLSLVWLAALVLYATYAEWWGGRVFGSRFLDDLAPVLFAALAWAIGVGLMRTLVERFVFAIMALWSFVIFQAAAF